MTTDAVKGSGAHEAEARPTSQAVVRDGLRARPERRGLVAVAVVGDIRLLLIALWLGAAVFFSFAVAPSD